MRKLIFNITFFSILYFLYKVTNIDLALLVALTVIVSNQLKQDHE
jgi:hypothetical protein